MKIDYDCRFQGRENKRNQLKELREQFEKDKQRIQKMKENRKFNPVLIVCFYIHYIKHFQIAICIIFSLNFLK